MFVWILATTALLLSHQSAEGFTVPSSKVFHPANRWAIIKVGNSLYLSHQEAETTKIDTRPIEEGINGSSIAVSSQVESDQEVFSWTKQWYPIIPESYIEDKKPVSLTILGRELVIWKTTNGEVSVLEDSCPHRRAPLSTGKIVGDQLACRYHGWEFNTTGTCTKIPMDASGKFAGKFCTKSYHAQVKGGLLWVFMSNEQVSPPPLPDEAVGMQDSNGWVAYLSPTSFLSLIENSFDPTHAPYTHEGSTFGCSPENAQAMERYEFTVPLSKTGFTLEHSAYQQMPPVAPDVVTTREFIPPCTNKVKSPFFTAILHFVPSKPGETLILGNFGGSSQKNGGPLQKLLPKRLQVAMKDFAQFWSLTSDGQYKFNMQDKLNMQGQDARKVRDKMWKDMAPTTSDAGVKAIQRWMGRYGSFGPFPLEELDAHRGRDISVWDSHGKMCSQFQATIGRLARVKKATRKISTISIGVSLFGAAASTLLMALGSIRASLRLLTPTVFFIALSVGARALAQFCSKLIERVFVTKEVDPHLRMMEIYPS